MKLFLIEQNENPVYDTYDSAVVAAPDRRQAKYIHPEGNPTGGSNSWFDIPEWWKEEWTGG